MRLGEYVSIIKTYVEKEDTNIKVDEELDIYESFKKSLIRNFKKKSKNEMT